MSYENDYNAITAAFNKAREENDIILGDLTLIPLRPTNEITIEKIAGGAKDQNLLSNNSKVAVLRGIKDLDIPLTEKQGGATRTLRTFLKEQWLPSPGGDKRYLFKQVEHATYDRVYLVHKEEYAQAVRGFLKRIDHTLKQSFTENSLEAIKLEENGSQKIGELNSPQSVEITKNSQHLNRLFPELSAEEEATNNKEGNAPQRHKPRRTFHATFERQEKPTSIPAGKKSRNAWDTPLATTQRSPETQSPTTEI